MTNVNQGHRGRMRKRMMQEGTQNFQDHEVLEMFLYGPQPRQDTNKLAHELLNIFGDITNVMDASPEQLMTVKGVSTVTACQVALMKELWRRYKLCASKRVALRSTGDIIKYAQKLMAQSYEERLMVAYLDGANNVLTTEEITSRSAQRVDVDIKKLVASALRLNTSGVILFHCHLGAECKPSADDLEFTQRVFDTLANINIMLLEHIIFNSSGQYYSFYKEKELERCALNHRRLRGN